MTASGIEIPALSGLVSAIRLILDGIRVPKAKRQQWFQDHIEPSYKLLSDIHREYIQKFQEAATLLRERGDVNKVVALLREERPRKLLERTEATALIRSLAEASIKKKPFPRSTKTPSELYQLFTMYVFSYERYLNSASPLDPDGRNQTWYSYFIEAFSKVVRDGKDPYAYGYDGRTQGPTIIADAAQTLERAVSSVMPDAFKDVQTRYMELRAYCLSGGVP
jgi:hypothetical protein